jgi:hypothetical protein
VQGLQALLGPSSGLSGGRFDVHGFTVEGCP